jgi:uncharacterized protein
MKPIIRVAILAFAVACGSPLAGLVQAQQAAAPAQTVDPERLAAARDLLEVTGVTKQFDGMMEAIKKGFANGAKAETSETGKQLSAEFDQGMEKFMAYKQDMINDFALLYAETFTAEEMKTIADFYRSGTGAKFISMTPELMQKGSTIGMKYSQKIVESMKAGDAAGKP